MSTELEEQTSKGAATPSQALPSTPREFEAWLREAGFSRSRAKAITATGFKSTDPDAEQREAAEAELVAALLELRRAIGAQPHGEGEVGSPRA